MKRMAPEHRNGILNDLLEKLKHDWLCRYGQWNCDKLLHELEKKLRAKRMKKDG
jgi:hypothetical protein